MAIALAAAACIASAARAQSAYTATVNPGLVTVTDFEGWGTSLCWWANVVGGYSNRGIYASLAFSTLKLNIVRYNIGGGENPGLTNTMEFRARMPGFELEPGVWNWSADANQRWMLRQAVALGANRVVAFANSPPWWMTVSGSVTGSADGTSNNLQTHYENGFAAYLATVVSNLTVLDGVHFDFVTPMNEPLGGWWKLGGRQEGCHTSADQQARVVNDLRAQLNSHNVQAGIDASEDNNEQDAINSLNAYGGARGNVALITTHTYGANNPGGIRSLAATWHKPAWVSEYGDGDGSGMTMARRIHDDIAGAWVRAWVYWQFVDNAGGWGMLYNPLDGSGNTAFSVNKKFYVMGQFSRYLRPACQIFSVDDNNSLAAYDATNHTLTIVAVNDTGHDLSVTYNLKAFDSLPSKVSAIRTSATENQASLAGISVTNKSFTTSLISQSVTTFVLNNVTLPPPSNAPTAWYRFEGNAVDDSRNANDGILSSTVTFVPGKLGSLAAQFNGVDSYVQIPRCISNDFTIAFWLRTRDTGASGQWWAGKGLVDGEVNGTVDDFGVSLVGGSVALGIGNPDTTIVSANAVNDGQWHHLAATRDAVSGQMVVYADGILQASGFGPVGTKAAPPVLRIGSSQAGYAGDFFNGTIDDVQIFDRVFGPSEIASLMNHPPIIASAPGNYTILAGRTLTVTNTATDPDTPAQTLSWSLLSAMPGALVNASNGVFTWRPSMVQSPGTNLVTLRVADNGIPVMDAKQSFTVAVIRPQTPALDEGNLTAGDFGFQVTGDAGPDYIIETSTNLDNASDWSPLFTNLSAAPPFRWADPSPAASARKFYRIVLGP